MLISEAHNVLRFMPYSEHKQGSSGTLFCTNFKVTFITANDQQHKVSVSTLYICVTHYLIFKFQRYCCDFSVLIGSRLLEFLQ